MQTAPIIEGIQADVAALGAVGGETAVRVASQIAAALGSSLRARLLEAVSEAAGELSPQLPEGQVEVRVQGGEPVLVFVQDAPSARKVEPEDAPEARITLRLSETLKSQVDAAAAREGVSVNTWLIQLIARSVGARTRRIGSRVTGFARS